MKWVNPPVAYMLHAGVPLLLEAGVHLPHLHPGDVSRVALEGYPGLLARELIGGARTRATRARSRPMRAPRRGATSSKRSKRAQPPRPRPRDRRRPARLAGGRRQCRPARRRALHAAGRVGRRAPRPRPAGRARPDRRVDRDGIARRVKRGRRRAELRAAWLPTRNGAFRTDGAVPASAMVPRVEFALWSAIIGLLLVLVALSDSLLHACRSARRCSTGWSAWR